MGNTHPVSPLRGWLGGKYRLAGTIIPLIPSDHTCYAEVFGGAAWVLFKKPPSKVEAINDINADVINLYRCVQNHLPELLRQAEYLLPSRDEYYRLQHCNPTTLTDIQRAVRFLYLHRMGFGGKVAEQLRHIKGRFLLSINDVPAIREIFTGFQFKEVSLRYSINKEATTEADELLIANYPINIEQAESA